MRLDDLGLIGNCQYAALVHRDGTVAWCCLPRFDSEPIFGSLLDEAGGGRFQVGPASGAPGVQRYLPNTNVLETIFDDGTDAFRLVDFAPRFEQHERSFRPTQLFRVLEPLRGQPRLRVVCDPRLGWSRQHPQVLQGSNHLRYEGFDAPLRLTTDVPLSYLATGQTFALTGRRHLALSWGQPIEEPLQPLTDRFLGETVRYWRRWVKGCAVPVLYQDEVIRSALALKLHCFEDTGAIVAATTTSIPEAPGSGRTWDYRYCWLRDAYYVLGAFHLLGHFEERERFIQWLFDVAGGSPDLDLAPLYRVDGRTDLEERLVPGWPGFGGNGPVRVGNGAALQRQNDIFGETALALSPVFLDERFQDEQSPATSKSHWMKRSRSSKCPSR
jgi:GH15 family glucan-1,4-alpha-glucosidase